MLNNFSYIRPKTLKEAVKELSVKGAGLHAGGTDLLGCLRDHVFDIRKMVSISGLKELEGIKGVADGKMRIGAMTTISQVAGDSAIKEHYAALAQAAAEVASPQLRNQGTLGGNLCQKPRCWYYRGEFNCLRKGGEKCFAVAGENQYHCILGGGPCFIVHPSDLAPALIAFDAIVHIAGMRGTRSVPVEKFHVLPSTDIHRETVLAEGEVVVEVILPAARNVTSSYRKVRARAAWDFALAGVALAMRFDKGLVAEARVVLSGAAPVPWRSQKAEAALVGRKLDPAAAAAAADAALKDAQPLAKNGYKVPLFRALIEDQLNAMAPRA
jgi:xanthine dehydrogenase YagS FAD-binding subunit